MVLGLLENIDKVSVGDRLTVCSQERYMVYGGEVLKKWFIQSETPDEEDYYYILLQIGKDSVAITTNEIYRIVSLMKPDEDGEYYQVSDEIAAENLGLDLENLDLMKILKGYIEDGVTDVEEITEAVTIAYNIKGNEVLENLVKCVIRQIEYESGIYDDKQKKALSRLCKK